jgi:NAD+ kinase
MKVFIAGQKSGAVYDEVAAVFDVAEAIADCDIVITIGGDGTILKAGIEAAIRKKPLLGINMGRLGFMATLEADELDKLSRLARGEFTTSRRMFLDASVGGESWTAFNDIVLHREATARLPDFVLCRNEIEVLNIRADGMIVATATGSTAYSLSAGGPILEPELECVMVTAVCPHTLFNRSMVFAPNGRLAISANDVSVIVDGHAVTAFAEQNEVVVTKSQHYLEIIDIDGDCFYNSIHNKLIKPLK